MLRALLALLLLANLLFFGWTHAWFAPVLKPPRAGEHEPERVAAQLRPEAVVVLPGDAASAAISAARATAAACLEAGPLDDAGAAAAEAVLIKAGLPEGSWLRETAAPAPQWLVYAGRVANPAALRERANELRKLKLSFEVIDTPAELATGIVLSRHASRMEAEAALARASSPSLKGLRVVALPAPPSQVWLRSPLAGSELQLQLMALQADALAGGFRACASRP